MNRFYGLVLLFLFAFVVEGMSQSTEHLSQLNNTSLFLSPAEGGTTKNFRTIVDYRNQWRTIATPYTVNSVSFDLPLLRGKIGFGAFVFQENLGDKQLKNLNGKLAMAYHLKSKFATKDRISFGIETGILQFSNNGANAVWEEQWNGFYFDENKTPSDQMAFGKSIKSSFDLGAGLSWGAVYLNQFKVRAGVALKHLTKPAVSTIESKVTLNRKLNVYGSVEIREQRNSSVVFSNKPFFTPDFLYSRQGDMKQILLGTFVSFPIQIRAKYTQNGSNVFFKVGAHLRLKDAIIINTAFRFNNYYIGLSYDYTMSKLRTAGGMTSSFELLLRYSIPVLK